MTEATKELSDVEFFDILREQETNGTIDPGMKKVLDIAVNTGKYPQKTKADVLMNFVKSAPGKMLGTVGGEITGESAGRAIAGAAVDAVNPAKKVGLLGKGIKTLGALAGIGGGNAAAQKIIEPDQPIDKGETALATAFGGLGLGVGAGVNKFRSRGDDVGFGNFEGAKSNQTTKPIALQATERLSEAGIPARLANVLRNQYYEIMDGLASTVPPAASKMKTLQRNIQDFYEDKIEGFAGHLVDSMPKLHLSRLSKDLVTDSVNLARQTSQRNFQELDDIVESGVNLNFMNKGVVGFKEAGVLLEQASKANFKLIRKQMKVAISEHVAAMNKKLKIQERGNTKKTQNLASALENLKKTKGQDTAKNRKFLTESFKHENDPSLLTKSLKGRIDNAIIFSEKYQGKLAKTFMNTLAKKQPEVFLDAFLKPQGPDTLRKAMDMLTPDLRRQIRSSFLGKIDIGSTGGLLQQASKMGAGGVAQLDGPQLLKAIGQWEKGYGEEMSKAMFPIKGMEGLKQLAKELSVFQSKEGASTGATAAFLLVPSAAAGIATGLVTGDMMDAGFVTGAGIIFIPLRYAYKFNDVKFVKKLTGLSKRGNWADGTPKTIESSKSAIRRATLLVTQLAKEGVNASFIENEKEPVSGFGSNQLTQ